MFYAHIVNSIGLLLDIGGVILLWKYGLPEEISRSGAGALLLEQTDEAEKAKAALYDRRSKIALCLIGGGFALQFISNWI